MHHIPRDSRQTYQSTETVVPSVSNDATRAGDECKVTCLVLPDLIRDRRLRRHDRWPFKVDSASQVLWSTGRSCWSNTTQIFRVGGKVTVFYSVSVCSVVWPKQFRNCHWYFLTNIVSTIITYNHMFTDDKQLFAYVQCPCFIGFNR